MNEWPDYIVIKWYYLKESFLYLEWPLTFDCHDPKIWNHVNVRICPLRFCWWFFLLSLYCLFTPYVYSYIIWQMIYELSVYIEKYTPLTLYISIIYKLYSWEQVDSSQLGHSTVNRWFSLLWFSHLRRKLD